VKAVGDDDDARCIEDVIEQSSSWCAARAA